MKWLGSRRHGIIILGIWDVRQCATKATISAAKLRDNRLQSLPCRTRDRNHTMAITDRARRDMNGFALHSKPCFAGERCERPVCQTAAVWSIFINTNQEYRQNRVPCRAANWVLRRKHHQKQQKKHAAIQLPAWHHPNPLPLCPDPSSSCATATLSYDIPRSTADDAVSSWPIKCTLMNWF